VGNSENLKNIFQISPEKSDHAVEGIIGNVLTNETTIFDHEAMRFSLSKSRFFVSVELTVRRLECDIKDKGMCLQGESKQLVVLLTFFIHPTSLSSPITITKDNDQRSAN